jgi:chromosome segregation ATPase
MESPHYISPRAHSPTKSPAKGLEKLITELKLERQKCTNALQERSKLKIELEKVKQSLVESQEELHATEAHNQRLVETFTAAEKKIYELEADLLSKSDDFKQLSKRNLKLEEENLQLSQELDAFKDDRSQLGRGDRGTSDAVAEIESTVQAKNAIIQQLESEVRQLKRVNESTERKLVDLSHVLDLKNREAEDGRALHLRIEEISSSYQRLQQTCEELRHELEDSLEKNNDLSSKFKDVTEQSR